MDNFTHISEILKSDSFRVAESPIEYRMISALKYLGFKPIMQYKIGNFRADIYLETEKDKIVIECDGAAYHQDKDRDNKRDAYMRKRGFKVFRFTGAEIHANAYECIYMIFNDIGGIKHTVLSRLVELAFPNL